MFARNLIGAGLTITLVAGVVRAETQPPAKGVKTEKPRLQQKQLGNIRPLHVFGDVYLAGQPSPEDLPILKRADVKTIITLRKPGEIRWPEQGAVEDLGMKFVQVPFAAAEELTPKVFDDLRKLLNNKKHGPTVLHCASANRVGAIWYAHRVLDGKLSHEAALKEATTVGLRSKALLERAQAYVQQMQRKSRSVGSPKN